MRQQGKQLILMQWDTVANDWRSMRVMETFPREDVPSDVIFIPLEKWSPPSPNYCMGKYDG